MLIVGMLICMVALQLKSIDEPDKIAVSHLSATNSHHLLLMSSPGLTANVAVTTFLKGREAVSCDSFLPCHWSYCCLFLGWYLWSFCPVW